MSDKATRIPGVTLDDVLGAVAVFYGVSMQDMRSPIRQHSLVQARDMFFLLGARVVGSTSGRMAAWLGGRSRWSAIHSLHRARARFSADRLFFSSVLEIEAGLRAIDELRDSKRIRAIASRDPLVVARAIVSGDNRVLMGVTLDELRSLAAELLALHDTHEAEAQLQEAPDEKEADPPPPPPPPPAPPPAPAPRPKDDAVGVLVHDFVGVEAMLRSKPSINLRKERDGLIETMRAHRGESGAVDAVVAAFDAMRKAEFTACERGATESYRAAVRTLANGFLKAQEHAANG